MAGAHPSYAYTSSPFLKMLSSSLLLLLSAAALAAVDADGAQMLGVSHVAPQSVDGAAQAASFDQHVDQEVLRSQLRGKLMASRRKSVITAIVLLGAAAAAAAVSFLAWKCFKSVGGKAKSGSGSSKRRLASDDEEGEGEGDTCEPAGSDDTSVPGEEDYWLVEDIEQTAMREHQLSDAQRDLSQRLSKLNEGDAMSLESRGLIEELKKTTEAAANLLADYKASKVAYWDRKRSAKREGREDPNLKRHEDALLIQRHDVNDCFSDMLRALETIAKFERDWCLQRGYPAPRDKDDGHRRWSTARSYFLEDALSFHTKRQLTTGAAAESPVRVASKERYAEVKLIFDQANEQYRKFLELQAAFFKAKEEAENAPEDAALQETARSARRDLYLQQLATEEIFVKHEELQDALLTFEVKWCRENGAALPEDSDYDDYDTDGDEDGVRPRSGSAEDGGDEDEGDDE